MLLKILRKGIVGLVASVMVLFPLSFAQASTDTPWVFANAGSAYANQGQEYLCITNATESSANIYVSYIFADKSILGMQYIVPPNSQHTINVNDEAGDKFAAGVSVEVYTWNALVTPELISY